MKTILKGLAKRVKNPYFIVSFSIVVTAFIVSLVLFPQSYSRLGQAFSYLFSVFTTLSNKEFVPTFPNLDVGGTSFTIPTDLKEFLYDFKAFSIALINRDVFLEYIIQVLNGLKHILDITYYLPMVALSILTVAVLILEKRENGRAGDTKTLARYKKFEQKRIIPLKLAWWRLRRYWYDHDWFKSSLVIILAISYRVAAMIVEFFGWYFVLLKTKSSETIFAFLGSILYDIFLVFYRYDVTAIIVISVIGILWLRRRRGRKYLKRLQAYKEEFAEGLGIATIISGPMGSNKTKMAISLTEDLQKILRNQMFDIIKKYTMMFPDFPWPKLEEDIIRHLPIEMGDERLVNRAQLKEYVERIYFENTSAWDYDRTIYDDKFFDGIQYIGLNKAIEAYAQAFFLYLADKPLAFSNIGLRFDYEREGFFPIYDYDYIERDKVFIDQDAWYKYMANIINYDFRRITNHVQSDPDEYYLMDGQVEFYTEGDKSRGNQKDHQGLSKQSEEPNPINDGWNRSVKVTRHEFTIDNIPVTRLLMDLQREPSLNADLLETFENHVHIIKWDNVDIAMPGFVMDYILCVPITSLFMKYYFKFRENRRDNTLYNYLLKKFASIFGKHLLRVVNEYSFTRLDINMITGVSHGEADEKVRQYYYIIHQQAHSDKYRTDCYGAFFDAQRLTAKKGFLDAKQYETTLATREELESQNDYWIDELGEFELFSGTKKKNKDEVTSSKSTSKTIYK